jgi:hypothetical protein
LRVNSGNRGDIILNPLDARCPYWGPSEELRRRAEARAIAASLYQPTTDKKGEFFTETPQKIFAHLLTFGPSPQELVEWMANPDEVDRRVQNTEMAMMIAKGAQQQRNGVLASLGLIADIFATSGKVTKETEKKWQQEISKELGLELHVMSREEIISSLQKPGNADLCCTHVSCSEILLVPK